MTMKHASDQEINDDLKIKDPEILDGEVVNDSTINTIYMIEVFGEDGHRMMLTQASSVLDEATHAARRAGGHVVEFTRKRIVR